jgi:hypothetical protein
VQSKTLRVRSSFKVLTTTSYSFSLGLADKYWKYEGSTYYDKSTTPSSWQPLAQPGTAMKSSKSIFF